PSLRSFGPTENPGSSACTTNAEMPSVGLAASGSVTAITVYQLDAPALVIQVFVPLSTHESFCHRARLRIEAVSLPASRSDNAYVMVVSPEAVGGSTCLFRSSAAANRMGWGPMLFTAGISYARA